MLIETMFEERGWEDALYPGINVYAWRKDGGGLLIEPDKDDRWFTILAGEPTAGEPLVRITQFDDAAAAMDFCDRIAPLAGGTRPPNGCRPAAHPSSVGKCTRWPWNSPGGRIAGDNRAHRRAYSTRAAVFTMSGAQSPTVESGADGSRCDGLSDGH